MTSTPVADEQAFSPDFLREGIAAAGCVRFCGQPLDALTREELLSAAGYLYIELNALQQRLDAVDAALAREGFAVVDGPLPEAEASDEP